jgi:hypothetical protein
MPLQYFIRDFMRDYVSLVDRRIYTGRAPDNVQTPYVVMHRVADPRRIMGNRQLRLQFSCFDPQYGKAREVADQIREAIEAIGNDDANAIYASYDDSDVEMYEKDTKLHHIAVDGVFYFQDKSIWG